MRINYLRTMLKTGVRAATVLLFGAGVAGAQQVNLTAAATNAALPDGTTVPMWGYSCNGATGTGVACNALNPIAGANWSPVVLTVQSGSDLNIMLTNNLPAPVPTSLVIVGQFGGGLGTPEGFTTPPDHSGAQAVTWPIADPTTTGTPPQQLPRVQSFGTEVTNGKTATLTWTKPRPGTYLLESGTHPSIQATMGLVGMVVVTTSPTTGTGTAYASSGTGSPVTYNAELPVLFSEIDPVQTRGRHRQH